MSAALLDAPTDAAGFAAATGATSAQVADLERFRALLAEWNERMNLIGPAGLAEFWPRHAFDSAQLLEIAPAAKTWVDIGAGAGFPGLVLAILLKGRPGAKVTLVESVAKRCRFLHEIVQVLDLPAEVVNLRAEETALSADIVTARAVAPLEKLLGFAKPCLDRGATGLFLKGRSAESEIVAARASWRFACEAIPSRSDPEGRILKVDRLARIR